MADKKGIFYNEAAKAYFYGDCVSSIEPYGGGHINDTFLARTEKGNFVLQRVNGYVFPHPDEIMDNMVHVTKFLAEKLEKAGKDPKRTKRTSPGAKRSFWRRRMRSLGSTCSVKRPSRRPTVPRPADGASCLILSATS